MAKSHKGPFNNRLNSTISTDLILVGEVGHSLPVWELGKIVKAPFTPQGINEGVSKLLPETDASYILFWDPDLGWPQKNTIADLVTGSEDCWHAGLLLGTGGLPRFINFVSPVWSFTCDPEPAIVAMSWRLSLRACLVKTDVLRQLGGPETGFETVTGAGLELGHRWLKRGALLSHVPNLVEMRQATDTKNNLTLSDQFRFVRLRYGRLWTRWAFFRAWVNQVASFRELLQAWRQAVAGRAQFPQRTPLVRQRSRLPLKKETAVTILIPTLDRYPYLFKVLDQLRNQTYPLHEIIVVDQTDAEHRQPNWPDQFADLPLHVIWRDTPGQCSSRNAGLQYSTGNLILFLDDDNEIENDLIETHLQFLNEFKTAASCGVAEEIGAGNLPYEFSYSRSSDVFPTNNSLLSREALRQSGLFDLAFERGPRADGDLGMRLYRSGQTLMLNPDASVIHYHAPQGGLRQHKARKITRGGSKNTIRQRQLLEITEAYLWLRYFSPEQTREALLIRTLSTLRGSGNRWQRLVRLVYMLLWLPDTFQQNKKRLKLAEKLKSSYPKIPLLNDGEMQD